MAKAGAPKGNQNAKGNKGPWGDKPVTDLLRRVLAQNPKRARAIAENLATLAAKKDMRAVAAIRELLDRTEGKVAQPVTGEGGGPVEIRVKTF